MHDTGTVARALVSALDPLQEKFSRMHARLVPSAFAGDDEHLRALPLPIDWKWPTLEGYLRSFGAEVLLSQLPSFWQLEPYIFFAAREAHVPLITIDPQNYPLDKASILYAGATTVLAQRDEAERIAAYLKGAQVALPSGFVLVHAADATEFSVPSALKVAGVSVAHEVHLVPGVPLLVQCAHLCRAGAPEFHFADFIKWNESASAPRVSTRGLPFQLEDFPLPLSFEERGQCACGKPLLARSYTNAMSVANE